MLLFSSNRRAFALAVVLALFLDEIPRALAQAPAPPSPKEYQVKLRYRIYAGRNERLAQFFEMTHPPSPDDPQGGFLESIGFKKDEGALSEAEDPSETRMTGVIASADARKLLLHPRVKSILLLPPGYKPPEEGTVKVQLELAAGLPPDRQRLLAEQTRETLGELGFRESPGYDHRGYTRIVGTIPAGELETLLKDLRWQPAGWLAPATPFAELPRPLRDISPVRVTEVIPEPEGTPPVREAPPLPPPPEKGKEYLRKISPDLAELSAKEGADAPRRLEIILAYRPGDDEDLWRRILSEAVPNLVIEGRLGPLVTVLTSPKSAPTLAAAPFVSTVRLPRPPAPEVILPQGGKEGDIEALRAAGLLRLQKLGHRGKGVRLAIIDGDFRGFETLKGKGLPANTRYLDFTAELNPNLAPAPFPGDPQALGHGAECALTAALAAPEAELTLIRIDPESPHQLQAIARFLNGEPFQSDSYRQRFTEMEERRARLDSAKDNLLKKRREILNEFGMDKESVEKRAAYYKEQALFDAQEKAFHQHVDRLIGMQRDFQDLKNTRVVYSSFVWNEGHPQGGVSPLSQYLDGNPFKSVLWFQPAGNTRGQAWSGLYRDSDGNGVMEFAPPGARLPPGRWTPELNFLAWRPYAPLAKGEVVLPDLPDKLKLRITLQWREAHDPEFHRQTDDRYREPLAKLKMLVLRLRDPQGEKISGDDMEVVARSSGLPQRLDSQPTSAVYEQALELTTAPGGRYALRIEGQVPTDIRPPDVPTLPVMRKFWELRPRIFVEVADPAFRKQGRAVFVDYPTDLGTLGTPADSRAVLTVGAVDPEGGLRSYSAMGPAWNLELLSKPDVLSYDGLTVGRAQTASAFGTSQAAAFAAGLTAAAFSAGTEQSYFLRALRQRADLPLRVP